MARFLRDVGINLLANLIAAAIIYLLGVLAGVFPFVGVLMILSLLFVGLGLSAVGVAVQVVAAHRRSDRMERTGTMLALVGVWTTFGFYAVLVIFGGFNPWISGLFAIALAGAVATSVGTFRDWRAKRAASEVQGSLISLEDRPRGLVLTFPVEPPAWSPNPHGYL